MEMFKTDLVDWIYERYEFKENVTKKAISEVIDATFDSISDLYKKDITLNLYTFGTFFNRTFKGRRGYNVKAGEVLEYGDVKIPSFSACLPLRNDVKKRFKKNGDNNKG